MIVPSNSVIKKIYNVDFEKLKFKYYIKLKSKF